MRFYIAFQDPATVYAYSLMFVHHQVMWYMFIILSVVYWSLYRIIKEYNWHSFNKQNGVLYVYTYTTNAIFVCELIFNQIIIYITVLLHKYLIQHNLGWYGLWTQKGKKLQLQNQGTIYKYIVYYTNLASKRLALTISTVTNYYTGGTLQLSNIDNKYIYQPLIATNLVKELTLAKYWYYSTYNRAVNAYMYSYYNKESQDFLQVQAYRDNLYLELIWAFFPSLVIFLILIPSLYLLYSLEENLQPKFNIKVIGHQWFWSYEFDSAKYDLSFEFDSTMVLESDLTYGSRRLLEVSNRLYLPLNVPLRILVTSSDVLHSWAVPEMGIKVDAVPGRLNDCVTIIRRPGVFYGQCSELCGVGHAFMPIVVEACTYKKWLSIVKA